MYCGPAMAGAAGVAFVTPVLRPTAAVEMNTAADTAFRLITLSPLGYFSYSARHRTAWRATSAKEVGNTHLPASAVHYNARPDGLLDRPEGRSTAEFAPA